MPLRRGEDGVWTLEVGPEDQSSLSESHASYLDALPRYLTALDTAFQRAIATSEFNFILSILAVRGMQDAGWDPYETTVRAITAVRKIAVEVEGEAARHLALWLYGHIVEASEPYEFLSNLVDVSVGGSFRIERFPPRGGGVPLSPGAKIHQLSEQARSAGMPNVVLPMKEAWNRDFRNAIFHADYTLYGSEVRTIRPAATYTHDETMTLVNRALAYHEAMSMLRRIHIESYSEPTRIPANPEFARVPGEEAIVIVRAGYGATGLRDGWSEDDLRRGCIPYRLGRFTQDEMLLLQANPQLAMLPAREVTRGTSS